MSSMNRAQLIGRLGRDPESRRLNNGSTVVNLRLATSETWKDKQSGERKEATEWHQIVIYNEGLAKVAEQYLKKGSLVMIEGKITTRKWQDQSGADRYTTEIVGDTFTILSRKENNPQDGGDSGNSGISLPKTGDDLPF